MHFNKWKWLDNYDNQRMPINGSSTETTLYASDDQAEQTSGGNLIDFLSNGFKPRGTNTNMNGSRTYAYMAFAEHPFIGSKTKKDLVQLLRDRLVYMQQIFNNRNITK